LSIESGKEMIGINGLLSWLLVLRSNKSKRRSAKRNGIKFIL